ncbi:contact-dependent growth inhibition system immunity protein [Chitinophaga nivalis]|uniref:Contact-dependent growth inhibition system immunity protein n=1 Tax=Chitinophaga nivalis TaxID=2991709 RepID=A0ABT3IPN7_9BACT|nr:contact-dependent growth inhibition system immunity protein [Chitinophaga nivalis]MCW3464615.1 contact-dependent growth inhibition system immunity protein [Chitinophaga nivalis]MCW3485694.1 contact-dependent growth inhibition system immunity protein [Chitinophaga nivalis]
MNKKDIWRYKSLEQLENKSWGTATEEDSGLTKKCIALSKVPLAKLTAGELRILIGQSFNPTYLVPLAIEKLKDDVLVEAGLYPGDLLKNVLDVPATFWEAHQDLQKDVKVMLQERSVEIETEIDLPGYWRGA